MSILKRKRKDVIVEKFSAYDVIELSTELDKTYDNFDNTDNVERVKIGELVFGDYCDTNVGIYFTKENGVNVISTDVNDYMYLLDKGDAIETAEEVFEDVAIAIYGEKDYVMMKYM